jgi:hypothetical protein
MIKNNRLDIVFGPVGSTAGVLLFLTGLAVTWFSFAGLFLVVLGAFAGFTSTSTIIDFENKRVRFSNNLFGILRLGKWINVEPEMKLGISKSRKGWKSYSRAGVPLEINEKDFRLVLYGSGERQIIPLKKADSMEKAKHELTKLSEQLGIGII